MPINQLTEEGFGMMVGSAGASFTGLLDEYGGAAAGYSVRRLSGSYSGALIEVRRSSDNAVQDIGYDGDGNLDTTSLLSFVGAGDGFVRTWYDQSGNANNAQQTTTSNQPQIVSSGVVLQRGSKSSIDFGTTLNSCSLNITTNDFENSLLELYNVLSIDNHDASGSIYFSTSANTLFWQHGPASTSHTTQGGGSFSTTAINDGIPRLIVDYPTLTLKKCDINNNTFTNSQSSNLVASGVDTFVLGKWEAGTNWDLDGAFQEFVIYTSNQDLNRLGIKLNINTYFSIY